MISEVFSYTLYTVAIGASNSMTSMMANITESVMMTIGKCDHQSTEILGLIIEN